MQVTGQAPTMHSLRTRVPNCGSRREPPETPLRVCGIRWRPVSRGLTALKRPVACILDTHHSRSGHEIENLRGGQSVRTPPSAQLRATRLDIKNENLQLMSVLKLGAMFSISMSSRCHK